MDPVNVDEALEWAVKIEENLIALGLLNIPGSTQNNPHRNLPFYPHRPNHYPKYPPPSFTHKNSQPSQNTHNPPNPYTQRNPQNANHHPNRQSPYENTRRLSDREFQDKKAKGLCYGCDEKWRMGHVCKKKELSVLIVAEDVEEREEWEAEDDERSEVEPVSAGISLNSVVGIDNPRTMKLEGTIKGNKVIVMIDPGATHNFISPDIIRRFELPVEST